MPKDLKFQRKLVEELRNGSSYQEASIYTVLLDLVETSGIEEVFQMLHNVASDLDKKKELEAVIEKSKNWKWEV